MPVAALTAARTRTSGGRSRRRHRLAAITGVLALTLSAVFILVPTAAASDRTLSVTGAANGGRASGVAVGAGSYTTTPVGKLPSGCGRISTDPRQFLTANAPSGAVPTNDWWSSLVFKRLNCQYSEILQAHPAAYLPDAAVLASRIRRPASCVIPARGLQEYHYPYQQDFTAGVGGLNAPIVKVDDWSDWTVTPSWERRLPLDDGHDRARPTDDLLQGRRRGRAADVGCDTPVWHNDGATVGFAVNGHDYVAYAPTGAGWTVSGSRSRRTWRARITTRWRCFRPPRRSSDNER